MLSDYDRVEQLRLREEKMEVKKEGLVGKVEKKSEELVTIKGKMKGLEFKNNTLEDEVKELKRISEKLRDKGICLEEEKRVLSENEKGAQERIVTLADEVGELVAVKTILKELELIKVSLEDEVKECKRACDSLKVEVICLEEKKMELEKKSKELVTVKGNLKELEFRNNSLEDELKDSKRSCVELKENVMCLEEEKSVLSVREKRAQERIMTLADEAEEFVAVKITLKELEKTCDSLKEEVVCLEEEKRYVSDRERRAQERIVVLSEEIKVVERKGREKYLQLETENKGYECARLKAEDEVEVWKKRFKELEKRVLILEEETSVLLNQESQLCRNVEVKENGFYEESGKTEENNTSELQSEANGGAMGTHSAKRSENVHIADNLAGLPSIDIPCKPLANMKEGEKSVSLEAKVEYGTRVKKQLEFDLVGSSIKEIDLPKLGTKRSTFRGIIDISDNEDEDEDTPKQSNFRRNGATCVSSDHTTVGMRSAKSLKVVDLELDVESGSNSDELPLTRTPKRKRAHNVVSTDSEDDIDNTPTSTSNLRDKGNTCLSGNPTMVEMNSRTCLKRIHLNQEDEGKGSSCGEFPLTRTPRRKRAPNLTDSEDEDKDKVHIRKLLKTKRLEELTDGVDIARESLPSTHPTLTFGNAHVKDFASPSRPRLTPLRKCKEKIGGERSLSNSLEKIGPSHKKSEILACEDSEESERGEVRLDVNNENMNGFIVDSSEDTEDTDSDDAGVDWREIISKLGSKNSNKLNWEYEADMLASFEVDPEPCMRAVCALYRQQTSEEKSIKGSLHHNNRGFNRYDALRGTTLAEFLLGGDRDGDLKKSAEELKKHDPLGIQECNRMARHYSKQLFSIYRNKEDPYFLASS